MRGIRIGTLIVACLIAFSVGVLEIVQADDDAATSADASAPSNFTSSNKAEGPKVEFTRDILPIFRGKCYSCHGKEEQEGGFRIDRKSRALEGGDQGHAIVPGKADESLLLKLVSGLDEEIGLMPPEGEGTPLSKEEIALVKQWIDQGAQWPDSDDEEDGESDHWSFQPIQNPKLPKVKNRGWIRNGIDAFVLNKLEQEKVNPRGEADRNTLIRRLYLDLIGLPPTPEELDRWTTDPSDHWYDHVVDHLLKSPHYGERWGRHWLDLSRYADSDGYEKDRARPHAWRWRKWVIDAFNNDLPFDQFTIQQIAGDMLPDATREQKIATGFHRNTLINREGGIDPEEDRVKRTVDRTNTVGSVWMGLTVGCCQCHTHKYDPLTQREYFKFYAFFNSLQEPDIGAPFDWQIAKYEKDRQQFKKNHKDKFEKPIREYEEGKLAEALTAWETAGPDTSPTWVSVAPHSMEAAKGSTLEVLDDQSIFASGDNPPRDEAYTLRFRTNLTDIKAIRLEALTDDRLPNNGPGRNTNGDFSVSMFNVYVSSVNDPEKEVEYRMVNAKATFSKSGTEVARAINNRFHDSWRIAPQTGKDHIATFESKKPFGFKEGTEIKIVIRQAYNLYLHHNLGRFRISFSTQALPVPLKGMTADLAGTLATNVNERSKEQQFELLDYFKTVDPQLKKLRDAAAANLKKHPSNPEDTTKAQVVQELKKSRDTHLHLRGNFLQKGPKVERGTFAVLASLETEKEETAASRLDLAQWLVSAEHPLTARVTVNRIWSRYFGRGLVATINDFGTQGETPSHPELLDWLATQFRTNGWSMKALHRMIVTSATYRQSSEVRDELAERDPYNTWLACQNRLRVEAEIVRDLALSVSGLMSHNVGGRSVHPPQPPGIEKLGYANSLRWKTSSGDDRYRRGMYTFFQRTVPYPTFMTFDCPDSNVACVKRDRSNTPLQALALLNDPVFFEASQALGRRIVKEVPKTSTPSDTAASRIRYAYRLCLARDPQPEELKIVSQLFAEQIEQLKENETLAVELIGDKEVPGDVKKVELAGWVIVGRTLMNLDEFITRE